MESRYEKFIFYESYFKALKLIKNDSERAKGYDTICEYALNGTEPDLENLPESVAIAFFLIQNELELSRKRAIAGEKGGKSKLGKNQDQCYEIVKEYKRITGKNLAKINQEELKNYEVKFGKEICIRAISIATEAGEKKANWRYIKGIFKVLDEKGIKSIEEWEKEENRHKIKAKDKNYNPTVERIDKNNKWLDEFLKTTKND